MVAHSDYPFNVGAYSVPEASRITGVAPGRLRRWLQGYAYQLASGAARTTEALWAREHPTVEGGELVLSFRDLIEAQWVSFFRDKHVPWPTIKAVAAKVSEELGTSHPFTTGRFAAVATGKSRRSDTIAHLLPNAIKDVLSDQLFIHGVVAPFIEQLEFKNDALRRWFPLSGSRRVVLDPRIQFGRPTVISGVPTELLWRNHHFGRASYRALANWWRVPEAEVRDAVRWERERRAA